MLPSRSYIEGGINNLVKCINYVLLIENLNPFFRAKISTNFIMSWRFFSTRPLQHSTLRFTISSEKLPDQGGDPPAFSLSHRATTRKFWNQIRSLLGKRTCKPPNQTISFTNQDGAVKTCATSSVVAKYFTKQFTSIEPHA